MPAPALDRLFLDFQSAVAGRYSLERELGRGGMGIVYLAREVRLDRFVAIKLLPPAMAGNERLRERFLREARTAAKLSHPNIIPIHAVEEIGDFVFFAMAYVEGETLTERVRARGPLPPSEAARALREVAWALAYAHGQGVIHRDVKPDNILLETASGRVLVADFGIAGLVKGAAALDGGEVIGTPEFMSPEQALGEQVDARSDVYSLGVVAFFTLSGRLPFEGARASEVLAKQVTEPAPPLAAVAPGVPRRLAQGIDRCLAKDAADRPPGAVEVAEQFGHALDQRRELPVALRAFVKHGARLDGPGVAFYPMALLLGSGLAGSVLSLAGAWTTLIGGLTVVPLGVLVNRARRLVAAGFEHADLGVAFKTEMERGREERTFGIGHGPSILERLLRGLSYLSLGTAGVTLTLIALSSGLIPVSLVRLFAMSLVTGVGTGLGALIRLQRRRDVDTEFWGKLWTGRLGRWMFKVAHLFLPTRTLPAAMTHRPTELAIGMAAEQLFDDLPKATRHQLRELPAVLRRLEDDAQRMRARLEELQDVLGEAGARSREPGDGSIAARHDRVMQDLQAERDLVQKRLADAVAALETIRLNLLRLHAGTGTVQSLTTDLGLAREVAKEIDLLLEGAREVEEELGR